MFMLVYTYVSTHVYVYLSADADVAVYIFLYTHTHIHIHVCMYVYMYLRTFLYKPDSHHLYQQFSTQRPSFSTFVRSAVGLPGSGVGNSESPRPVLERLKCRGL